MGHKAWSDAHPSLADTDAFLLARTVWSIPQMLFSRGAQTYSSNDTLFIWRCNRQQPRIWVGHLKAWCLLYCYPKKPVKFLSPSSNIKLNHPFIHLFISFLTAYPGKCCRLLLLLLLYNIFILDDLNGGESFCIVICGSGPTLDIVMTQVTKMLQPCSTALWVRSLEYGAIGRVRAEESAHYLRCGRCGRWQPRYIWRCQVYSLWCQNGVWRTSDLSSKREQWGCGRPETWQWRDICCYPELEVE